METAIIAGVGPGLAGIPGACFCARQDYAVAFLSRSAETSTRVSEEIRPANGKALVIQTDVTRPDSVRTPWSKSDQSCAELPPWHTTPVVTVAAVS